MVAELHEVLGSSPAIAFSHVQELDGLNFKLLLCLVEKILAFNSNYISEFRQEPNRIKGLNI